MLQYHYSHLLLFLAGGLILMVLRSLQLWPIKSREYFILRFARVLTLAESIPETSETFDAIENINNSPSF